MHLRTAPPVRLKSTLRHETSNSSEENHLPRANRKYISRWALVASQASGEEAKRRRKIRHGARRGAPRSDGRTPALNRTVGASATGGGKTESVLRGEKNFGNGSRAVRGGNVPEVQQIVKQNFSSRVSQEKFCTSCAALMELVLDECARLREIADSSEKVARPPRASVRGKHASMRRQPPETNCPDPRRNRGPIGSPAPRKFASGVIQRRGHSSG